ncbi:MAG TPA: prolyl oligopeptidase family serine peptidase [Steroidobacteraceae bacterium]|nr:prolyl oligopeptidase family serine peptidase [Steroidobacteraceae bacterium]
MMNRPIHSYRTWTVVVAATLLAACGHTPAPQTAHANALQYPEAQRGTQVDKYDGVNVQDPYRWFEDLDSQQTKNWVAAENRLSQPYLESIPARGWIKQRLTQLWNYERFSVPVKEGGRYFWLRNDGLQNQSVLFVTDGLQAPARVLLDPNVLSSDATVALADFHVSPDGRYLAYALSDGGTDWKTWHIRDVNTGQDLADVLKDAKFTDVSWERDSSAFFYSRYPLRADGSGDDSKQVSIYRHEVGAAQSRDTFVYAVTDHPTRNPYPEVTEDGRYLLINLFDGYQTNGVYYAPLPLKASATGAEVVRLLDDWRGYYTFFGSDGPVFYFWTTEDSPRARVVAIDTRHPARAMWRTVVPEAADAIQDATYLGGKVVVTYLHDAHSQARIFDTGGRLIKEVTLPGKGTIDGFRGHADSSETFFSYADYLTPTSIYHYDVASKRADLFRAPKIAADTSRFVTEQVFYTSKDGTRVPMFITHRADLKKDGGTPTLLYGYGGFNNPLTPAFSVPVLVWLEMGGTYAVANLRGGSEYGEAWHLAGTRAHKQNVFDDFIAAAHYLVDERYTSREQLAILGRSNGGLLIGAVITQDPGLVAAALPAVGVLDMLRYHTASANARQWSSDYGLSENPQDFPALYSYSPYHNVHAGTCYPPTLITTADHDDRVVPWHSFKFGAALQAAQGCKNPILLRVETRAGHGAGKPVWMQIEDFADQWAFLSRNLRMDVPEVAAKSRAAGGGS